ncbi:MAG: hypothetical protein P8H90_06725 [Tateyamaria sp.]|nr:hypothetical protein [Tateyamaria sp.]MDG1419760.1 hypothetical protein [Tateyamaria sp.]MDG1678846.1 hypothetical protein [Tateyamaria sp.]
MLRSVNLRWKKIFVISSKVFSPSERRAMIRKDNTDLSLMRHFKLLKIRRPSIYYTPVGFDQATIDMMHEIGRIFTRHPFFGSR